MFSQTPKDLISFGLRREVIIALIAKNSHAFSKILQFAFLCLPIRGKTVYNGNRTG